jgi:DNA mismatch endonuclease (patch repair protein)
MDKHTKEQRRKNMQAVKSKGSKMENMLADALLLAGFVFERNCTDVLGKPDFLFRDKQLAVFCDSEFFHGKDWETKKHEIKSNREFWHKKIEQNIRRDAFVNEKLSEQGYTVLRFWEKEIKNELDACLKKISSVLHSSDNLPHCTRILSK